MRWGVKGQMVVQVVYDVVIIGLVVDCEGCIIEDKNLDRYRR